jgi:hypothetical protein
VAPDPQALDPKLGTDVFERLRVLAGSYDQTVATSSKPICRYKAKFVVARRSPNASRPRWLIEAYQNDDYVLFRVAPGTCRR